MSQTLREITNLTRHAFIFYFLVMIFSEIMTFEKSPTFGECVHQNKCAAALKKNCKPND